MQVAEKSLGCFGVNLTAVWLKLSKLMPKPSKDFFIDA